MPSFRSVAGFAVIFICCKRKNICLIKQIFCHVFLIGVWICRGVALPMTKTSAKAVL
jgi:hypothetical protein